MTTESLRHPEFLRFGMCCLTIVGVYSLLGGCQEGYTAPGAGADLRAFGVQPMAPTLEEPSANAVTPQAQFPAVIAAIRVQGEGYRRSGARSYSVGSFTIVATRDVETDIRFKHFGAHPMIRGIMPLSYLSLPAQINGRSDICSAARNLGADMVLIYTLDSAASVIHHVPELSVATLGLAPEGNATARCTASAVLLDARTGFTYAVSEASDEQNRLTSAWGSDSSRRKAMQAAEKRAFHALLDDLSTRWTEVVREHAIK